MTLITTAFAQGTHAARPAAAAGNAGFYYLETDTNGGTLFQSTGSAWVQLAPGVSAGGLSDPTTTKGDLIVHGTTTTRLGVGSDGQVLTADSTQALGVKWGAAGGGAMTQVAETILSVDTATITFSSIPGTARGLRLVFTGRSTAAVTTDSLLLRLNGDTGSNYDSQKLQGNGSTVTAGESLGQTAFTMAALVGASAAANFASHFVVEINDYARTNWYKDITVMANEKAGNASGFIVLAQFGGGWRSTAAVTSLTLLCAANLAAGSVATLYSIT